MAGLLSSSLAQVNTTVIDDYDETTSITTPATTAMPTSIIPDTTTNLTLTASPFNIVTQQIINATAARDYDDETNIKYNFIIGVSLAISSSLFIGASFIIKKKALLRIGRHNSARAGLGGYGYLREWMWWLGLTLMALGEAANFIAYAFAPATLVTPLGAISVLVSTVLSSYILKERLNILGKIGCIMCTLGSVAIILHAPHDENVANMDSLQKMLGEPGFICYVVIVILISLFLMFYLGPRYGDKNMLIYIIICSVIGSLSVMACKGIGIAIIETSKGFNQFTNWLTWFSIFALILTVSVQMNYLNKALDIYNTSIVSAIYYVFFTTAVLCASAILFKEWENMTATNLIGVFTGFAIIVCAIFLLNVFKDIDLTLTTVQEFIKNQAPSTSEPCDTSETTVLFPGSTKSGNSSDNEKISKGSYESVTIDIAKRQK